MAVGTLVGEFRSNRVQNLVGCFDKCLDVSFPLLDVNHEFCGFFHGLMVHLVFMGASS